MCGVEATDLDAVVVFAGQAVAILPEPRSQQLRTSLRELLTSFHDPCDSLLPTLEDYLEGELRERSRQERPTSANVCRQQSGISPMCDASWARVRTRLPHSSDAGRSRARVRSSQANNHGFKPHYEE